MDYKEKYKKEIEAQNFIIKQIEDIENTFEYTKAMNTLLKNVGKYTNADRAYIFTVEEGSYSNAFEWCRKGVKPSIGELQNMSAALTKNFTSILSEGRSLMIANLEDEKNNFKEEYSFLNPHKVESVVVAPLIKNRELIAFIGVDNPRVDTLETVERLLKLICPSLARRMADESSISYRQYEVLSRITQMLYSYNLSVDLDTGKYSLITGTGMDRTLDVFRSTDDYSFAMDILAKNVHPLYLSRIDELLNLKNLRRARNKTGLLGTMEYPVFYEDSDKYEWQEVSAFIEIDKKGKTVANILGRDITDIHEKQETNERELHTAAEKNRILSEVTKMLYSYNITLNLVTGKFSIIVGTGMKDFVDIFSKTDDFNTAYREKLQNVDPEYVEYIESAINIDVLRQKKNNNGLITSLEYKVNTNNGVEWHEVNVFLSTSETGIPTANILGRDITEQHKRQEEKEKEQKAAIAKDLLLSDITKLLYNFNATVNLETWKYKIIVGKSMKEGNAFFENTDDYILTLAWAKTKLDPKWHKEFDDLIGVEALVNSKNRKGFIGRIVVPTVGKNSIKWVEINLFMTTDEDGNAIADILGRDVTEEQEKTECKRSRK